MIDINDPEVEVMLQRFVASFREKMEHAAKCKALEDDAKPVLVGKAVLQITAASFEPNFCSKELQKDYWKMKRSLEHFI